VRSPRPATSAAQGPADHRAAHQPRADQRAAPASRRCSAEHGRSTSSLRAGAHTTLGSYPRRQWPAAPPPRNDDRQRMERSYHDNTTQRHGVGPTVPTAEPGEPAARHLHQARSLPTRPARWQARLGHRWSGRQLSARRCSHRSPRHRADRSATVCRPATPPADKPGVSLPSPGTAVPNAATPASANRC
jgi:hypothetical protein